MQVPVNKTKVVVEDRVKTVFDTQVRTRCVPVTKMGTKQIPVYSVVAKPAGSSPPGTDCGQGGGMAAGGMAAGGAAMVGGAAMGGDGGGMGAMGGMGSMGGGGFSSGGGSAGFGGGSMGGGD